MIKTAVYLTLKPQTEISEEKPLKHLALTKYLEKKFETSYTYIPSINPNDSNDNKDIDKHIDDSDNINSCSNSFKEDNYLQRENELKKNRQNIINVKRINPEEVNEIRNIKD